MFLTRALCASVLASFLSCFGFSSETPGHADKNDRDDTSSANIGSATLPEILGPAPPEGASMVSRDDDGGATMRATRLVGDFVLDGRLDDAIYGRVEGVSGFIQALPDEGAPATENTEVWVFFDDRNVYVAARCWDSQPERMVANEMRRDNFGIFNNENLAVIFDTFYDRRNAFFFYVNPIGGLFDGLIADERNVNRDWNSVWDAKAARFDQGWTVEMAFPFKTLRYKAAGDQIWGINFRRVVRWKNELSYLTRLPASLGPRGITKISSAGTLVGLETPGGSRNLEVKPYAIGDTLTDREAVPRIENELDADFGFDVKYGLTRGLIADFTYNTDFAQVEADEQQVNLTRFSLFFPEKREFFLEGQGIFEFGGSSRGAPAGATRNFGPPSSTPILFFSRRIGLSSGGTAVPILAGGRVTGRTGKTSIGLLNIQTRDDVPSESFATNFSVVRLKRDILNRSTIGLIATHRSVGASGFGDNQAYGVDANLAFYENLRISSYVAATQTSELDGDSLSYRGQFDYDGDRYGFQAERLVVQEDFNPEVGFLRRQDFQRNFAQARFSPRTRSIDWLRQVGWTGSFDYTTDNDGNLETRLFGLDTRIELENADVFSVELTRNLEFLPEPFELTDDIVLPVDAYRFSTGRLSYQFGPQRRVNGNIGFQTGGFFGGERDEVSYRGRAELSSQITLEPSIAWNWIRLPQGDFTTGLVSTRLTYTLSPRSFLAAFLQFNSTSDSLSTNVRFRWEYEPGSDLFVVYTDQRDTFPSGFPQLENRSLIVKFTKLFRF